MERCAILAGQLMSETQRTNYSASTVSGTDAQAFENATNRIDFAYDGVWYQQDVSAFCSTMLTTKPELVFVDDEGLGSYPLHQFRLRTVLTSPQSMHFQPFSNGNNVIHKISSDALVDTLRGSSTSGNQRMH